MIVHEFKDDITVIPISDVHLGALEHNKSAWKQFCKMVEETPNMYVILGGDLINNSTRCSVANPFDEVIRPREQKVKMVEHLKPIKNKILCAVSGNHERRSLKESDIDLTYDIMARLSIEDLYRENMAFMKLCIGENEGYKKTNHVKYRTSFTFGVTHGAGGGIYTGATVNRNERFGNVIEGLDCLIVGHTHKGTVTKPSKIVVDSNHKTVSLKSYTVISSVSWLNYGGYAMQKMLLPAEVCNPQKILLGGNNVNKKLEISW